MPPTPTQPTDGEWTPFVTKGAPAPAEYLVDGPVVHWRFVTTPTPTHPTRTIDAKVTCVLCDDDGFEITVEAERYQSWRFVVADAAPYPVGSTIVLEVPA